MDSFQKNRSIYVFVADVLLSFGRLQLYLEVMPITYFFVMNRVSLQTLAMFCKNSSIYFVPPTDIPWSSQDMESNADKLWRTADMVNLLMQS